MRVCILQVNCETDFVARNDKFHNLVSTIIRSTQKHLSPKLLNTTNLASIDFLTSDSILNITDKERGGDTVADQIAEVVGHLQEKIAVPRGCALCCTNGLLCGHAYNNDSVQQGNIQMGTYGAILHLVGDDTAEPLSGRSDFTDLKTLGKRICQHIVGVNPQTVEESSSEGQALVNQPFLFDDSVTVGDLLQKNHVQVTRFVRYALGEKQDIPWTKF